MAELPMVTILLATLMALVQVGGGLAVGWWLRGRGMESADVSEGSTESERAYELTRRLLELSSGIAADVEDHSSQMEDIQKELSTVETSVATPLAEIALGAIARILDVNQRLNERLADAKLELNQRSKDLRTQTREARTDALTGLMNRRSFEFEYLRRWDRARDTGEELGVLFVDVDHFKAINDQYLHAVGDEVLRVVAQTLVETVGKTHAVTRYGGEEFAIVISGLTEESGKDLAERARQAVADPTWEIDGNRISVTVSCGLTMARMEEPLDVVTKRADTALYASKNGGRNCTHFHNGQECERVGEPASALDATEQTLDATEEGVAELQEFTAVCEQLQQRLAEVVEGEKAIDALESQLSARNGGPEHEDA